MKKILLLSLILVFTFSMLLMGISCNQEVAEEEVAEEEVAEEEVTEEEVAEEEVEPIKVAVGSICAKTDTSWGQSIYEGSLYLKENYPEVEIGFTDLIPWGDTRNWLELQGEAGTNVVFLDSNSTWFEQLVEVAPKYPDTWFVTGGGGFHLNNLLPDNVTVYMVAEEEGEYLSGIIAGMMTKTNKIGFVAGYDYPMIYANFKAWELGAESVNPDVEATYYVVGAWGDTEKHYESSRALIDQGHDLLNQDVDTLGFFKAAQEADVMVFGTHRDQYDNAPDHVLTSSLTMHAEMFAVALERYMAGTISKEGQKFWLKDGYEALAPLTNVADEIETKVDEVKEKIIIGDIIVPLLDKLEQ